MIAGEGTQTIRRSAKDIYEFILDFDQYRKADTKITRVYSLTWNGGSGEVCYAARFRGVPTPPILQLITVDPGRRIDVRSKPGTLAHLVTPFHGLFTFEELGDGTTRVFHREELDAPMPLRWLLEPWLGRWLAEDTAAEMVRLKQILEWPREASRTRD